jgi:cupin fold WbuC family metalloprotein
MTIDDNLLEDLLSNAASSSSLRINMDLRNSSEDQSQRMLNAMLPGTVVPIHRHQTTSETVIILRGRIEELLFDEFGVECSRTMLSVSGGSYGLQIPVGIWHTVVVYEPSVIIEMKDGKYVSQSYDDIWYYE